MVCVLVTMVFPSFLSSCSAQPLSGKKQLTRQDTLRGTITPERAWWDVQRYLISIKPDYASKSITGLVGIAINKVAGKSGTTLMQIDLQEPMVLDNAIFSVRLNDEAPREFTTPFRKEGNVYFLETKAFHDKIDSAFLTLYYHGKPREAVNPPWDGGWIWRKDEKGNPWMSVACQGLGASVWYPCKDHQSDEPNSGATLMIEVPDSLTAVGNGKLLNKFPGIGTTTYAWSVSNPINNYNIIPYIGKYVNFSEVYQGKKGALDCNYWVLDYNLEKAKQQFKQVPLMLKCFEHWFGPYPFYEDGYKLVESPHLGMEHQSAVAYGNKFKNGYLGRDLSGTGWGLKWDFIIIHESGHEWFANNITSNDIADMWVHEGFTAYSETLFTTCEYGVEAGNEYVIGTRSGIANDIPIIGQYGVNQEGSGDMYYKAANMIHIIRQLIGNDSIFRNILRGLNDTFYHKTVDTKQVEDYISAKAGKDFSKIFDQYLRTTQIPVLEYKTTKTTISYRWTNCVPGFNMPVKVNIGQPATGTGISLLSATTEWANTNPGDWYDGKTFVADKNFYVKSKKVN